MNIKTEICIRDMTKTVRKQPDRDIRSTVFRRLSTSWFRWVFWRWNKTNNEI